MIVCYVRDQWLSILVMVNYWRRRHGFAPDEWYWADRELMERGKHWMPCYWSWYRWHGLFLRQRTFLRIAYLRVRIWWLR